MPGASYGRSNCWLTVILGTPQEFGADREVVRLALEKENLESRPIWKPMHLQPVFEITPGARGIAHSDSKRHKARVVGGEVSENLFERGLCLPSETQMTEEDLKRVITVISNCHKPFHSAAYKHVPIVELNPWEGVFNNIVGTRNIVEASHRYEAERFIMISTDKAVRPTNVMGTTKRIAEMITSSYSSANPTRFVSVRFGNVIGSEGSVVHLFKKQIERLGPITVTHPEITRYFMTISEACKLILQAGAMGKGGEIFILDMGTPIKITNMARDLIRLSGFKPDEDIEIKFIGLRPGENLYEELITEGEGIIRTDYEKIFVLKKWLRPQLAQPKD